MQIVPHNSVSNGLKVGQMAEASHKITGQDLIDFARVSGDNNPIHLDDEQARAAGFARRVAHGTLLLSYLSSLIGNRMPGPGTVLVKLTMRFLKPVLVDEVFTSRVDILDIRSRFGFVIIRTRGMVGDDRRCDGESITRFSPDPGAAS